MRFSAVRRPCSPFTTAGWLGPSSIVDLPLSTVETFVFITIIYWMAGLAADATLYFGAMLARGPATVQNEPRLGRSVGHIQARAFREWHGLGMARFFFCIHHTHSSTARSGHFFNMKSTQWTLREGRWTITITIPSPNEVGTGLCCSRPYPKGRRRGCLLGQAF